MTEQRLIDANELLTAFPCGETVRTECVRATIKHMPTIEERKKGEWIVIEAPDIYVCPFCKHASSKKNFCATCGADMRGESE